MTGMKYPPFPPHLALNDFGVFLKIKSTLKGLRFQGIEHIQEMLLRYWKPIHNKNSKNVFNSGSIVGLIA
jgi:hypothetical protein